MWDQAIDDFCTHLRASGASKNTLRLRRHYLHRLAERCPAGPWAATPDDLTRYIARDDWAPETRKSARSAVRAFYGWAVLTDRLVKDPSRTLPAVRIPQAIPRPTPAPMIHLALERADERSRLMVLFAVLGGLRRSEIAAVHTDDLVDDELGRSLRVHGKGGKVRVVPLSPTLEQAIGHPSPGYLFPGKIDGHLSAGHVGKILGLLLGHGWSAHSLRHRFATNTYAVERDLRAVQLLLGHSKPETTARYTAVPEQALRTAVDEADPFLMSSATSSACLAVVAAEPIERLAA